MQPTCLLGLLSKDEVAKLEEEQNAMGPKIDALLAEWESLEAELAEAAAK